SSSRFANARVAWLLHAGEPEKAEAQLASPVWAANAEQLRAARPRLDAFRGRYRRAVAELDENAAHASKENDPWRAGENLYSKAEVLLLVGGDVGKSREAAASARSNAPGRLAFFLYLAQGDLDRAAIDSAWRSAAYLAAAGAAKEGRLGAAISQYESLATRDRLTEVFALFELAKLYLLVGEPRKAIRPLQLLQSRVPTDLALLSLRLVPSYHLLGQAHERSGDPAAALVAYRRVLRMWSDADPDLPDLVEIRVRVSALERAARTGPPLSARP